jgi:tyrocidine synthetase-3
MWTPRSPLTTEVVVRKHPTGEALYATRPFCAGEAVFWFEEVERRAARDRDTVQHPDGDHIYHPLLAAAAHCCEPSCCISFTDAAVVALREILPGEAITFDYETTEDAFANPFWCRCGAPGCRVRIG